MEIKRKYKVADAVLLEHAGVVIQELPNDLTAFGNFDPNLNQEKLTGMTNIYNDALNQGTDNQQKGKVKKLTENLAAAINDCVKVFKEVRYFAKKQFGRSPAVMKQFGLNRYRKARTSQPEMVVFMYEFYNVAQQYRDGLVEAGMKAEVIESIKTAADQLNSDNITQELGKDNRMSKTEERVVLMNSLYDELADFSEASKIVFANDPLKREKYIFPHSKSIDNSDDGEMA